MEAGWTSNSGVVHLMVQLGSKTRIFQLCSIIHENELLLWAPPWVSSGQRGEGTI